MLQTLPVEILHRIIGNLPVKTILALRQVSKPFNKVTRDRSTWAHAYRSSALVRPPGPFPWQTAEMLESSLVQSAQLSLNWPPNPNATPIQSRVIPIGRQRSVSLVCGRWLVTNTASHIMCFDLDYRESSTAILGPYAILYQCPRDSQIHDLRIKETFLRERSGDENHPCAFVVATYFNHLLSKMTTTLFSIILTDGMFPTMYMVPSNFPYPDDEEAMHVVDIGPKLLVMFAHIPEIEDALFTHVETYQQYKFQARGSEHLNDDYKFNGKIVVISSTHILVIRSYRDDVCKLHIQAYRVPSSQGPASVAQVVPHTLQLSHECSVASTYPDEGDYWTLLRDSNLDPLTGVVHITVSAECNSHRYISVLSFNLHPAPNNLVGSITVENLSINIPIRHPPSISIYFLPTLNGSARSAAIYRELGVIHVAAVVLDDEGEADTLRAVDSDMRCFRDLHLKYADSRQVAFDPYRGRIVTYDYDQGHATIFDFV
ncbi:hypothetical protein BJ138DRAFT_1111305 [Hygrophoropsis aurantiaca]|uniref:Uncharacterized protein n=1 Tax=Hygrophoropsis aurantiaca TaxID=72124 RepID=A0ACB8AKY1_9AGAM|nr:hypothetical protein BJ138DRAFT_1111305 [Hygrophoropsis aurantiaca]